MSYGNTVGSLRQVEVSSRIGEIVLGTLLGDGYLTPMKNGEVRLEVGHSAIQKEYVWWKYKELKPFVGARPHLVKVSDRRYGKTYLQWRFKTKADAFFLPFHQYFYGVDKKSVPESIVSYLAIAIKSCGMVYG